MKYLSSHPPPKKKQKKQKSLPIAVKLKNCPRENLEYGIRLEHELPRWFEFVLVPWDPLPVKLKSSRITLLLVA